MPTFDVTSEVDMQEVRNAVDQAVREVSQRYDFKGTNSDHRAHRERHQHGDCERGSAQRAQGRTRGETRQAQGVAQSARLRHDRGCKWRHRSPDCRPHGRDQLGQSPRDQQVHQGAGLPRGSNHKPRANSSESRARNATNSRASSPRSRKRTSTSRCSSATSETDG